MGRGIVIGSSRALAGLFQYLPDTRNLLAFRCIQYSHRLDAFWRYRTNPLAASNQSAPLAA